jgi:MscS family membrane protein
MRVFLLRRGRLCVFASALVPAFFVLLGCLRLKAAPPDTPPAPAETPVPEEEVAPDSPREAVVTFLALAREGRWDEAARYLDLPAADAARGPELARRLKAVLDANTWIEPDEISPLAGGREDDGLPPGVEEITKIPAAGGRPQPVRLVKRPGPEGERWLFTRGTVGRIDAQFGALRNRWALEHLPAPLLQPGPGELLRSCSWSATPSEFSSAG